uniref:HSF-type DNA-binding domain-containing protein n=1 Tax=Amphora coffeiformis TaxID=265554 RepID=A0A7S3L5V8_9STRA|mmetsp:Transcript_5341/g.10582  ORF Transcript_5341/g.10582 Transcript_5341/m.10582 type:complete len:301 (-) Transcript_5341:135-1037(-)
MTDEKPVPEGVNVGEDDDHRDGDKPEATINTNNAKDDCSDLTDNNHETDEQAPKSFPQKLMDILSDEVHADIISWLPHGTGFQIHKKKTFAAEILPKHFKASKFTSFTRKLNRWGFTRVPRGPETGAYFHKLFRRDQPHLCSSMTSNSGNKYQANPMQQQLLPNIPGMGMMPFPYMPAMMPTPMSPGMGGNNMTPQQQQVMWQQMQNMQNMMMFQQQMMQMQQAGMNPQGMNAAGMNSPGMSNMNNMSNMNSPNPMSSMINVPPMTGNKTDDRTDGQGKKNENAGRGIKGEPRPGDSEDV